MRLTMRGNNGKAYWKSGVNEGYRPCDNMNRQEVERLDKLAAYEDAEEQGLLVRLPCKVGSSVWERDNAGRLYKHTILITYITDRGILFDTDLGITFDETAIGSEMFLTREEAEAALKEKS